jgi:hypothetical protein
MGFEVELPFGATPFAKNHSARISSRLAASVVQGIVLCAGEPRPAGAGKRGFGGTARDLRARQLDAGTTIQLLGSIGVFSSMLRPPA